MKEENKGKITAIKIFIEKGKPPVDVKMADCTLDCGLQQDRYAKGGERQLTLVDGAVLAQIKSSEAKGLCTQRFNANIETENFDVNAVCPKDILLCGDVEFEVSQAKKECFDQCDFRKNNTRCPLPESVLFLKVKKSGKIKINDKIESKL
ncbi:MAG: hypothetical protein RR728_09100 [Oscillospiraceae bacterium]